MQVGDLVRYAFRPNEIYLVTWVCAGGRLCKLWEFPDNQVFAADGAGKLEIISERKEKNSPRTLDIDIICFDDLIINDDNLNIPHPNLHKRPFVFLPLRDLDKSWKHPVFLKTIDEFVKEFDPNELKSVKKIL